MKYNTNILVIIIIVLSYWISSIEDIDFFIIGLIYKM